MTSVPSLWGGVEDSPDSPFPQGRSSTGVTHLVSRGVVPAPP